jgi:uncharacterized protein Yka (UPF0111/DUF47 family)
MKATEVSLARRLLRKVFPPIPDFQGLIAEQARLLERTFEALAAFLVLTPGRHAEEVRRCVQQAHAMAQSNLDRLHRSFVTRIDREDIYMLITRVDHVFDYCETSVREIELLRLSADPSMKAMVARLREGAAALASGLEKFRTDMDGAEAMSAHARQAEREVEELYRQALVGLFSEHEAGAPGAARELSTEACLALVFDHMKRREVYRHLSNAADRLAHAGEALHDVTVKYG